MSSEEPTFRFDHAVILVLGLKGATRAWERSGFSVVPGGRHAGGLTENALVPLSDGGYLELLASRSPTLPYLLRVARFLPFWAEMIAGRAGFTRRILHHAAQRIGFVEWAVATSNLDVAVAAARERGLAIGDPIEMGRTRPDGTELRWKIAFPHAIELPFLIEDLTPRSDRVPPSREHESGVRSVAAVEIAVRDIESTARRFEALFGLSVARTLSDYANVVVEKGAAFLALGDTRVIVVRGRPGRDPSGAVRLWMERAGEGTPASTARRAGLMYINAARRKSAAASL